jgi:hypothetical protein
MVDMKRVWPVALCALLFPGVAWAEDDVEPNEDPFREDEGKAEEEREEGEDGEDSEDGESEDGESERKPKRKPRSFGGQGDFAVSAERIVGFARTSNTIEVEGAPDQKNGFSRLNLLVNGNGSLLGYSAPRIGFDGFAVDGFSIGAAVGYSSTSGDNGTKLLLAQLRFGYAYMFTRAVGVWPRVGATVESIEMGNTKIGVFAVGGDLSLVIVPTSSAFFTFGPTLDAGLVGKYDPEGPGNKTDIVVDEIGLWASVGVTF